MKTLKKRLAGELAQKNGVDFEKTVLAQLTAGGFAVIKIHTGARVMGGKRVVLIKNAFDFVAYKFKIGAMFLDAKSRLAGSRISYSAVNEKKDGKYSSFANQVRVLHEFEKQGAMAFFLIGYQSLDRCGILLPSQLLRLKKGESLGLSSSPCDAGPYNMIDFSNIIRFFNKRLEHKEEIGLISSGYRIG